jgi:hypothetical protein
MLRRVDETLSRRGRAALRYAGQGWPVIPLHWIRHGMCSCKNPQCPSPAKHPLVGHGVFDGTTYPWKVRGWWTERPDANIGVVTGRRSGIAVLDVDPRNGGFKSLELLQEKYGPLPYGAEVKTGGGGVHLYYSCTEAGVKSRVGLAPGIDLCGDGKYVVAPGSIHHSGKRYAYTYGKTPKKAGLPALPEWLIFTKPHHLSETKIPEGQRHTTLVSLGGVMRSRGMTSQGIEAALCEENNLRCDPALPNSEVIDISRSIARYAPGGADIHSAFHKEEVPAERKSLKFRTGKQIANETPAEVPWIAEPFVVSGAISEFDGKIKLGKTTFVTHFLHAILDGSPFLDKPTTKSKVVYLSEQPLGSFRAAMERARLLGRKDISVLFWAESMGISWHSIADSAVKECKRIGAKLLVVDTLGQFAGLVGDSENNSGDALRALRPLQKAAAEGIAVVIVRHERKSGGALGDAGRGSSAFAGAVDIIVSLRRPEGNQPRNVRLLQALSRFDNPDDLLIELTDEGYRPLGAPGDAAKAQAAAELLSMIPKSRKKATTINDLVNRTNRSRAQLQNLLDALVEADEILKSGDGHKGNPYRYFKA